jgi:hypothetical protein
MERDAIQVGMGWQKDSFLRGVNEKDRRQCWEFAKARMMMKKAAHPSRQIYCRSLHPE